MKYFLSILFVSFLAFSCMDLDDTSQDLCIPVICGNTQNDKVNFTVYNDSGIDFDSFYFDISGESDSTGFLPLQQYTCWYNFDTLNTTYFVASGISEDESFHSDTLWLNSSNETYTSGIYVLEVLRSDDDKLTFDFKEEFEGDCKGI
ncbi:hypothetical protein MATR_20930 [Marivirga tractuosa]|uniref:Lipoprotein n=1 Tax=Marivirga tractuosa (strain ATCC 23168 / DSM 4126 / NBRC 15989 / NCIMB 1408 / VKM B-1430 / H-43) TaxID=643867 RepID=E4TLZ9_MARTH|nr:hypothetical protein [Marivirga tractuosa]ADR20290.1 hypothetical protein Ftrac_0281 [Marivirga tractuosa DSM 4126]BDD15268.1 hypothetical protein MATR_20930 [Marivirga tractuosa]